MKLAPTADYRSFLKEELERRCAKNARYSLRAFARDLGLSSARMSQMLSGKGGISRERAEEAGKKMGFTAREREYFGTLVEKEHGRSALKRQLASVRLKQFEVPEYQQVQQDTFKVISDWYHYALLELVTVQGFKPSPAWIARALEITEMEAKLALERLERLGMLEWKNGTWGAKEEFTASSDGIPSDSLKKFHQQLILKAEKALTLQSVEERNITSITLAFDSKRMPEAVEKLKTFRRQFDRDMAGKSEADSVYCLAIQFFNLTKGLK